MPSEMHARAWRVPLRWQAVVLLTVILLAFAIRLFRLDHQSLWVDEATSAYLTTLSPAGIVLDRANDLHPPTYFLALLGWAALAGRSEFSLRFLSAGAGLLLVPLIYRVCRRLFADSRTGLLAAFLAALSPASVVYSQEARMYALLPLAYVAVLACLLAGDGLRERRAWILLAVTEAACLYLHFFSIFVVLTVNVLVLMSRMWRAGERTWRYWATSQLLVGLGYVPWLVAMWRWGTELPAKLSRRDWRAGEMSPTRFLGLLWDFLNSGLTEIRQVPAAAWLLGILGALTVAAVLLAFRFDRRRRLLLGLTGALVFPLIGAYPVWYMRPLAHPRYLLLLLAPLLPVLARALAVLSRRPRAWVVSVALFGAILTCDVIALKAAFFDTRFFRPDMRALSAAVGGRSSPGEAVIMPPSDYSLWYYDPAPAEPVNLPGEIGAEGGRLRPRELEPLLAGRPGAFLVTYRDLRTVDPRGQIPFLLETNGHLLERFSVDRMDVDHYELEAGWRFPDPAPVRVTLGPLALTGVYYQAAGAGGAVAVALRWRLTQPTDINYKATVRLWDGERRLAGADVRLLNELGRPTSRWSASEQTLNYYVLAPPLGTAPLTYTLAVHVYGGKDGSHLTWETGEEWLTLGRVRVLQAVGQTTDPYGSWSGVEWRSPAVGEPADGLLLEGYALRPEVLKPGSTLYVTLRWRAALDNLAHYAPRLVLRQGGAVLADDAGPLFERYPTERWAAGELLIETRRLSVPPTLAPLQLALAMGERTVPVGEVRVTRDALRWDVPVTALPACAQVGQLAELAGYEWLPVPEQPGTWQLTLYWRALTDAPSVESYTVFTHLQGSEGLLLAQHDGLPQAGERPTTTWLPAEVIADCHELRLSGPYAGPARLVAGMYDLATMLRLPAYDCAGRRLPDDAIPLAEIVIEETP